ncbi:hypothetical protein [Terrihabitans soli]|nr:hypothetical protein [Terrihabitans soli]
MTRLLSLLGGFLIAWGGFVLVTGDFVATVDIAAGLVASGIGVIALAQVAKALERIAGLLAERNQMPVMRPVEAPRPPMQAQPQPQPQPHAQLQPQPHPQVPVSGERRPPADPERRPPQAEPDIKPQPEPARREAPAAPPVEAGPKVVREGVIEGQRFRFFEDGSIEAEGPRGIRRFRSIEEAREQIMRDRAEPPQNQKPAQPPADRRPPDEARAPRMPAEAETPPGQRPAAKQEQDLTWDAYLSGGRKAENEPARLPDDDQWSEPFRMLLRGDAPPADPKANKR